MNTVDAVQNDDTPPKPHPSPQHTPPCRLTGMMACTTVQKGIMGYYIYVLYDR